VTFLELYVQQFGDTFWELFLGSFVLIFGSLKQQFDVVV